MASACICAFDPRFCGCKAASSYIHPAAFIIPEKVNQFTNPSYAYAIVPLPASPKQIREANHFMLKDPVRRGLVELGWGVASTSSGSQGGEPKAKS